VPAEPVRAVAEVQLSPSGLAFEESGPDGAPVVVLVHGSMDRGSGMAFVAKRLDDRFRVLRYDRRGYARSLSLPGPLTVDQHVADLAELLAGRPAVLFGHSFGGNVALGLASAHPHLAVGVVVYESPMSWEPWWPQGTAGSLAVRASAEGHDPGETAETFMRALVGNKVWERLPQRTRDERRAEGVALVAELSDLRLRPPYDPDAIHVPVIVARGDQGRPHHVQASEVLPLRLPKGVGPVVIHETGHGVHRSRPDEAAGLVLQACRLAGDPWEAAAGHG
jgi:pimeloyl-ACP methyl ester carboxylesterase